MGEEVVGLVSYIKSKVAEALWIERAAGQPPAHHASLGALTHIKKLDDCLGQSVPDFW